jgi:chromosome partitioning protein
MHDAGSTGSLNYLNLAREVLQKNKMTTLTQEQKEIKVKE